MTHQMENGFTRIADSLLDALALADLSKRELKIMLVVLRRTYGFGKKHAPLSASFIAQATGIQRQHIASTISAMVQRGILHREHTQHANLLGINKAWFPSPETVTVGSPETGTVASPKTGTPTVPKTGTPHVPKQVHKRETSIDTSKDIPPISPPFAEFWTKYPRKVAKSKAAAAWRLLKQSERDAAFAALPSWPFQPDPQFQPHAATWLRQRRWEDEPDTAPTTTTRSNGNGRTNGTGHRGQRTTADILDDANAADAAYEAGQGYGSAMDQDGNLVR